MASRWRLALTRNNPDKSLAEVTQAVALSDADLALFVLEGYGTHRQGDYANGELRRAFAAGDPDVYECVTIYGRDRGGRRFYSECPYLYEGRTIVWDDPLTVDSTSDDARIEGGIWDRMGRGFEAQATRPGRSLSGVELAYVLDLDAVSFELKAPPRNEPCPCGSGLKSKHCCWR